MILAGIRIGSTRNEGVPAIRGQVRNRTGSPSFRRVLPARAQTAASSCTRASSPRSRPSASAASPAIGSRDDARGGRRQSRAVLRDMGVCRVARA